MSRCQFMRLVPVLWQWPPTRIFMQATRDQFQRLVIHLPPEQTSQVFLCKKECGVRGFPFQHFVEKPLVRVLDSYFPVQPLPDMYKPTLAITAADEAISMVGDFLPFMVEIPS